MNFIHAATIALWIIPLVLQSFIAIVMFFRGQVRIFPVFFAYTVLVISREILLMFLRYPGNRYAYVYWYGEGLAVLLGLGVVFEAIRYLFRQTPLLGILIKSAWILCVFAATASVVMLITTPASAADRGIESVLMLERSARFLQVCMFMAVMAVLSRLGLTWHAYSVGIIVGFGVYSALDLTALEVRGHLQAMTDVMFELLKPAAYNLACFIWAFYFLRSWRAGPIGDPPTLNLREWNAVVTDHIDQWRRRS